MIGHLAYFAALMAPEIADVAADAAGSLVEKTGRRLAVGLCDEIEQRMKAGCGSVFGSLVDAVTSSSNGLADTLKTHAVPVLTRALDAEGVSVADKEELGLLRELAAQVATGADPKETLTRLKVHLAQKVVS